MVGTVIFKNFETGSYSEIKLVAYNGTAYADIGKGDFFSCRVNLAQKGIVYDFVSSDEAPCRSMTTVLFVAEKAREYLYQNPHITMAEYYFNSAECAFRPLSFKAGVYEPVDFRSLFNNGGFYKRVSEFKDKSPLWRSVLCETLNFCIQRMFETSERVFDFSSYAIYVNVSAFPRNVYGFLGLSDKHKKLAKSKNTMALRLKPKCKDCLEYSGSPVVQPFGRIVYLLSVYRIKCFNRFVETMKDTSSVKDRAQAVLSLPEDEYIIGLTDEFVRELSEFAMSYFDYGYLDAKSHKDMLTMREALLLTADAGLKDKISRTALARSVNSKLLDKLPCAPYFDSDGTAIWE